MRKWLTSCVAAAVLTVSCAASRPWSVPADLTVGNAAKIVGEAADNNALADLMRKVETTLLDTDQPRAAEFLSAALESGKLSDSQTATAEWMLNDVCLKNAPDSLAADFFFATVEASENMLHSFRPGEELLMILYDPTCRHCLEVIGELQEMEGLPTVLAVCIETPEKRWRQTLDLLPDGWVKAFDRTDVQENDLYIIRSLPSLYLLDGNRRVILKEPSTERLRQWLQQR